MGHLVENTLVVRRDSLGPVLRVDEGCARALAGEVEGANGDEMEQTWLGRIKAKERREARMETLQQAVQRAIRVRFPAARPSLAGRVQRIRTVTPLENLLDRVIVTGSVEEVERLLGVGA